MRRLIALTITALALTLAPFSAARAQNPPPSVTVSQPGAGDYAGTIQAEATVQLSDDNVDSIRSVKAELVSPTGALYGTFCSDDYAKPGPGSTPDQIVPRTTRVHLVFRWNTERAPGAASGACDNESNPVLGSGALTTNNTYKIKVTTETWGVAEQPGTSQSSQSGDLKVGNGPNTPTGVKIDYDKGAKTIGVSWSRNSEPDVGDYRVQECIVDKSSKPCGGGDWKTVKDNWGQTSITFGTAGVGIYRYRVAALRPAASGQTMVSGWAGATDEPTEIEVKADPPSTTTTQPQASPVGGAPPEPPKVQTRTVVQPTRRVARAAPQVVQRIVEEEPGYNTELPYEGQASGSGLPLDGSGEGEGQRAMLIPVAGGLAVLMFALQMQYLNRRVHAALETVPLDGEEWDREED